MSRLDQHVSAVRTRMTLSSWLKAVAWALMAYAIIVWAAILIDKLVQLHLPRQMIWFWAGLGVAVAGSIAFAIFTRPSTRQAAVAIDERLLLKEKFSTALYIRPSSDPFAKAALQDAEQTATRVNLAKRFPIEFPMAVIGTVAIALVVFLTAWLLPTFDLLGVHANSVAKTEAASLQQQQARDSIHRALMAIDSAPKAVAQRADIRLAKRELMAMHGQATLDPESAKGTAQKAVENIEKAIKDKIDANKDFAVQQEEAQQFKPLTPSPDETGPIADAQRNLAAGKLDQAVQDLSKAVNNFDKMEKKDQEKAAQQTDQMAKALQKMAQDPKVQQQVKDQLQKMGANQQQIQQAQNLMQQAAAGNQQAAQQLQNMANQIAQQGNQNSKLSPQQQRQAAQQVQKAMAQLQQKVNAQMNAQQLAASAQALAGAMKQAGQGGNAGQPKQGNNGQQQNANAQPQPGQQGQGNKQQQMADAAKQMQQQLQQMQAVANDAQQVAAGQQNAGQEGQDGNQNGGQNQNGQNGNGQQANAGQNPAWGNGQNAGAGGPAVGPGNNRPSPTEAPFQTKNETDSLQKDEKGKVLASSFVKAGSIRGEAKMALHDVLPPIDKNATDEVGDQRIPRQDEEAVRGYFGNIEKDAKQ